jgi:hypothetical protein
MCSSKVILFKNIPNKHHTHSCLDTSNDLCMLRVLTTLESTINYLPEHYWHMTNYLSVYASLDCYQL